MAVTMPEANMPAMNRKAAGASSMPPEMARPLVQPPAMPAAILQDDRADEQQQPALPELRAVGLLPLLVIHGADLEGAAGQRAQHAAEEDADQQHHGVGDLGRHDKVEVGVVEGGRSDRLAQHAGDVLEAARGAQQLAGEDHGGYAHEPEQHAGHIGRPEFLAEFFPEPVHSLSFVVLHDFKSDTSCRTSSSVDNLSRAVKTSEAAGRLSSLASALRPLAPSFSRLIGNVRARRPSIPCVTAFFS